VVTPQQGDVVVTSTLNDIAIITEEAIKKEIEL
jgi:hypothetical protein